MWVFAAALCLAQAQSGADRDLFGAAVVSVGDIDGGGLADIAIGDPVGAGQSRETGSVWLVSMESGRSLGEIVPPMPHQDFGWTLAAIGDVDGDARCDLAVGTLRWGWKPASDRAHVSGISTSDGRTLWQVDAEAEGLWFWWHAFGGGPPLCSVGDWNQDGCPDVAIGSPRHSDGADCRGRVDVVSGRDGTLIRRFVGEEEYTGLGVSLCSIGDFDGDGRGELAVGSASGKDNPCSQQRAKPSKVRIFSSSNGSLLATLEPETPSRVFGLSLAAADDLDGDGRADLWIGEPFANGIDPLTSPGVQGWSSGTWRQQLRAGPAVAMDAYEYRRFGTALVGLDDLDGDGCSDLLATNPQPWGSEAFVVAANGAILKQFNVDGTGEASSIGVVAADVGDLDGDGSRDVVLSGITVRGFATGTVAAWSPKRGARIRDFTRASIQGPLAKR